MAGLARRLGWCVAGYAALAWLPSVASEYHTHVFTIALYYVIVAVGWNLLAGHLAFLLVLALKPEGLFPKVQG